jgi:hypothetical protein
VFRYTPEDDAFQFSLSFPKQDVQKAELVSALQSILERLVRELQEDAKAPAASTASHRKSRAPEQSV